MPVTLAMNYKELYSQKTVNKIEELLVDSFCLEDIVEFIDENSEEDFLTYYEDYVNIGEQYSYGAVDAFIEEFGILCFSSNVFKDAYRGEWNSKAEYAENYVTNCCSVSYDLPDFIEIDWENTFDNLDCVYVNGFVFDSQF